MSNAPGTRESTNERSNSSEQNEVNIYWLACGAEFIGTFIHVFLGIAIECLCRVASTDSSVIEDYLPKFGWGLSWAVAFFVAGGISGGHFNGTVTIALCIAGYVKWTIMLMYLITQFVAALLAGLFAYGIYYWPMKRRFGDDESKYLFIGSAFGGAVKPGVTDSPFFYCFFASTLAALVLVSVGLFVTDHENMHVPRPMYGFLIGFLGIVPVALVTSYFYYGGVVLNLTADIGSRIYTLFSWEHDFINAFAGWIGCIAGGLFAVFINWCIHTSWFSQRKNVGTLNAPVGKRNSQTLVRNRT